MAQFRVASDVAQLPLMADVESQSIKIATSMSVQRRELRGPVRIDRFILHELNHRENSIQLVDEIPVLSDNDEQFFAAHIRHACEHGEWEATFDDPQGDVANLCRALIRTPEEFVSASRNLAQRLYNQMKLRTNTILPGDFVVALFLNASDATRHIAILKLDPDKRKTRSFDRSNGKCRVHFSEAKNIFPDVSNLHKCALISPDENNPDTFEIRLLDTQARLTADPVAAFFYKGFLTTELRISARRNTRDFIQGSDTWITSRSSKFSPQELLAFYDARRNSLAAERVDIRKFVDLALPTHSELRNELSTYLINSVFPKHKPDTVHFMVDKDIARQITQSVTIEIDGGGRIMIPAERFSDIVQVDMERTVENKTRIVIETQVFREIHGTLAKKSSNTNVQEP